MLEIGKLYRFSNNWSTGLYPSPVETQCVSIFREDDMFVLLEQKRISTYMHYKILTTKGELGWISIGSIFIQPVEEQQ